jgi:hypothetical protein
MTYIWSHLLTVNQKSKIRTRLGEVVQIELKTGIALRGSVSEKFGEGIRLSEAYVTNHLGPREEENSWSPCVGLVEVPYDEIATLQIISMGP